MPITTNRHTLSDSSASAKSLNGIQAPTKTNAATLNNKSMTELNTEASVCLLKNPSHAKAAPQENAARRSSEPMREVVPIVSIAKDTYCATYDCLSMRSLRSQNFMRCLKPYPIRAPITMPSTTWSFRRDRCEHNGQIRSKREEY